MTRHTLRLATGPGAELEASFAALRAELAKALRRVAG